MAPPTTQSKDEKRADLVKEVKMTVHLKTPFDGVCELANQYNFPQPRDIESFMASGLSTEQADVRIIIILLPHALLL